MQKAIDIASLVASALRTAWHASGELRIVVDDALDLADALLLDREPEQVPMICHEAITHLTAAGLTEHALPALTLMREVAATGKPIARAHPEHPRAGEARRGRRGCLRGNVLSVVAELA